MESSNQDHSMVCRILDENNGHTPIPPPCVMIESTVHHRLRLFYKLTQ